MHIGMRVSMLCVLHVCTAHRIRKMLVYSALVTFGFVCHSFDSYISMP